jgi:Zn-dependent protease with chaperone function
MTRSTDRWPPQSLVSGTTLRFAVLVFAVLAASTQLLTTLARLLPGNPRQGRTLEQFCRASYEARTANLDLRLDRSAVMNDATMRLLTEAKQEQLRCLAPMNRETALWVITGLTILMVTALLYYVATPRWKRWRRQLEPVRSRRLARTLASLVKESQLRRAPDFVQSARVTMNAVTFGRSGKYTVQLGAGLIPFHRSDPALFRAVVLHELAHIRNHDVEVGYAALAVWRAFLLVTLLPFTAAAALAVVLGGTGRWWSPSALVAELARVLTFVLIAYLTRNSVFRVRELHADARAASMPGMKKALTRAVDRAQTTWWWGTHPPARTRQAAIGQPQILLRPGFWELATTGCVGMVAVTAGVQYAALLMDTRTVDRLVPAAVMTLLLGVLTAIIWRWAVLAAQHNERRSPLLPALGLGLGLLVGDVLAKSGEPRFWGVLGSGSQLSVRAALVGATLLLTGLVLIAWWNAVIATMWLPVLRARSARFGWAGSTAATSVIFSPFFAVWYWYHVHPDLITWTWTLTAEAAEKRAVAYWEGPANAWITWEYVPFYDFVRGPLVIPSLVLIVLLPLLPRARSLLATATLVGLLGGAYLIAGQLLVRTLMPIWYPVATAQPGFGGYYIYWQTLFAVVGQAVIGAVVAARRLPIASALLAASVTGTIAALALPALGFTGSTMHAGLTRALLPTILVEGAIAAGVAAALVRVIRSGGPPWTSLALSRAALYAAPLPALLALDLVIAMTNRPAVYTLRGDVCMIVDASSLAPLAGTDRPSSKRSIPLTDNIPGGTCEIQMAGPNGSVGLNVEVALPGSPAAATEWFRLAKAYELETTDSNRTYRSPTDLGTQAWGWRQTEGGAATPTKPFQSTNYTIMVQDGGLYLDVKMYSFPRNRNPLIVPEWIDWPQDAEAIQSMIHTLIRRTMRNLAK